MENPGVVNNGQRAVAVAETCAPAQRSWPRAVRVSINSQQSVGAVKLPLKVRDAPGTRVIGPMTGVFATGILSVTKTLMSVTLPGLLTVPVNVNRPPRGVGWRGQFFVMAIRGVILTGQVVVTLAVTAV